MVAWAVDASELVAHIVPVMTVWREASGEGQDGMRAVAWAIQNRCVRRQQTPEQVCLARWQFSSMNGGSDPGMLHWPTADDPSFPIAYGAWTGARTAQFPDPTHGCTDYYATSITPPDWTKRSTFVVQVGHTRFYRE